MNPLYKGIYTQLPKSDNMSTEFKWTDELVEQLIWDEYRSPDVRRKVADFKASHSVSEGGESKPDWEIVEIHFGDLKSKDALSIYDFKVKGSRHAHWNIHSVRRLSDGEVFTVGDLVEDGGKNKKIIGLEINDSWTSGLFATIGFGGQTDLSLLTKAPEVKEPLFTTEDGKEIFSWHEIIWFVNSAWYVGSQQAASYDVEKLYHIKYFSTEQAANEYALLNKPCLSVNDIRGAYAKERDFVGTIWLVDRLKELAQSKLQQP